MVSLSMVVFDAVRVKRQGGVGRIRVYKEADPGG